MVACLCTELAFADSRAEGAAPADGDIFQSTNLLCITIEIPAWGMEELRRSQSSFQRKQTFQDKPRVSARVIEDGCVYTNVAVQLKGASSFRPVDSIPSLTLNFDKSGPNRKFHGLPKISLNNSTQDPTCLHEKFSRELFAAAGVPVPRSDYASVTLNGRALGLYVLAEGFSQQFLKRYFKQPDGNLYDGGVLQEIDGPLEVISGKNPTDHGGLRRLIAAARVPDPEKRFSALERALDLERFLSMIAMEAILCHSDSYSMNRNNYRVYHDPATDRMVFMPHGMDRVLGTHRSSLDLAIVPPMLGMVARAVISTPEGRRRYVGRAGVLFTNLFQPDRLRSRVREMSAKLSGGILDLPSVFRLDRILAPRRDQGVEELCARIAVRAQNLAGQFADTAEVLATAPAPEFGPDGTAPISGWRPRPIGGRSRPAYETTDAGGKQIVRSVVPDGVGMVSFHSRVLLPAGIYRLTGKIEIGGPEGEGSRRVVSGRMLRAMATRFGSEMRPLDWGNANLSFEVSAARAPEEIEFICDVRGGLGELRFDASSVRLVRGEISPNFYRALRP
jgi:hypothetical protein